MQAIFKHDFSFLEVPSSNCLYTVPADYTHPSPFQKTRLCVRTFRTWQTNTVAKLYSWKKLHGLYEPVKRVSLLASHFQLQLSQGLNGGGRRRLFLKRGSGPTIFKCDFAFFELPSSKYVRLVFEDYADPSQFQKTRVCFRCLRNWKTNRVAKLHN